jgi:MFS family permease
MVNFKQTVKLSHFEGGLYALMVASTESFLYFFALKQNISTFELAILSTLPLFLGAIAQLFIPKLVSDKYLGMSVVWTMLMQIFGVLGILYTALVQFDFSILLLSTCIHFIGGLSSSPLWIDWAARIIPRRNFRKYMANRSSYTWSLILIFYISLALLIENTTWFKLSYVFVIGAFARIFSCSMQALIIKGRFSKQISEKFSHSSHAQSTKSFFQFEIPSFIKSLLFVFIFWTALFRLSVQVSGPFFVSYMLKDLKLSLTQYVILSSIPYFGRAIFFNFWGRVGRGNHAFYSLILTIFYISIIPIVWTFSRSYFYLIATEVLAGMAWGGLELNQVLMVQNFVHKRSRDLLGAHMALTNFFGVIGALIGSKIIDSEITYGQLFYISSFLRIIVGMVLFINAFGLKNSQFSISGYKQYLRNLLPQ